MDSRLVWLCQLILLSVTYSDSWRVKANYQFATSRYSMSLNARKIKEDLKQRRQHARRSRPISLKPPPPDWPGPPVFDDAAPPAPATTVSPLLAYQARLEQELIEQQREAKNMHEPELEKHDESLEEISLDEEFKKLLDPDELLKHNKQLRPFVSKGGQKPLEIVKAAGKRGKKSSGSGGITSMTALKAKSAKKKARTSAAAGADDEATSAVPKRGQRSNLRSVQEFSVVFNQLSGGIKAKKEPLKPERPLSDGNLRKVKLKDILTEAPLKRRRKKKRNFAFANQIYVEEGENDFPDPPDNPRTKSGQPTTPSSAIHTAATTTTETIATTLPPRLLTTSTARTFQTSTNTTTSQTVESFISKTTSATKASIQGTGQETLKPTLTTEDEGFKINQTTVLLAASRKSEITEKRKQVEKEMEKVLYIEQLEGSFSGKESNWKTSEVNRVHLLNVTPKHAIFGILRHKIINIIDNIIRTKSKEYSEEGE